MRRLHGIVLALAAVLGLTVWAAPAGSAAGSATYKVWHWNVAGDESNYNSTTNGLVDAILGSVSYRDPDFISLNEVCPDQYRAILKGLQDRGWPQSSTNFARFEPMPDVDADVCKDDATGDSDPYGVAVFSRFAPSGTDRITLPSDGDKARKLLCVSIASQPGGLRFCSTHITFKPATRPAQLDAVRTQLQQWTSAGGTVITAGDFNTQPHDALLDSWYTPAVATADNGGNTGQFHELDDDDPSGLCPGWGEETTEGSLLGRCNQRAKVDLVWAAASRLVSYDEDAHPIATDRCTNRSGLYIPCSNHRIVDATLTVTTP
ncbi:endonuclease/exonuclease/phosphatase family protein [Streptomyces griseosporeus]|uniref:endonuclease/exonuclease/phosphatase family protein n=1 Tax=Streptomyces griseosporeus TaxID=1910 RepID=UPI0036FF2A04